MADRDLDTTTGGEVRRGLGMGCRFWPRTRTGSPIHVTYCDLVIDQLGIAMAVSDILTPITPSLRTRVLSETG